MSDNPIVFFICSLGVFNGFLVAFYFLFFNKERRVQNLMFGFLVLFLSMRIGKSLYVIFTPREERNITFIQIGLSACFLIGVSLFYYIKSTLENTKSLPKKWKWHIIILAIIILLIGFFFPYNTNRNLWNSYVVYSIYWVWGLYIAFSGYLLRNSIKGIFTNKAQLTTREHWLLGVFVANALIFAAYIFGLFFFYFVGTVTFSFVFYALLIFFLSKRNQAVIFQELREKYADKKITSDEAEVLISKLQSYVEEQECYKNTSVKISDLAKELKITPHKLSQLLNDNFGKSFAAFMNSYRIREAKKMLEKRKELTLEAIGFEAGFSSKSNFYATFKKEVGKTPSQYQQEFL
jgi:AraC-like DNA-binding protein